MNRKQILTSFLETIDCISDKSYQTRVWINGLGPEVDDFDETVCHFFQEGDGILDKHLEFNVSENQFEILKNFRDKFEKFSDENDLPEEFINTPEWQEITEMAKSVLRVFNYQKK